jgi:hypothetical protein
MSEHFPLHEGVYIDKASRSKERMSGARSKSAMRIDPDEVRANAFAAELLMPRGMLARDDNLNLVLGNVERPLRVQLSANGLRKSEEAT